MDTNTDLDERYAKLMAADSDVIHVLRSTHSNNAGLIGLADQKANVLIGIIAVLLTLLLTNPSFLDNLDNVATTVFYIAVGCELTGLISALIVIMPKSANHKVEPNISNINNSLFFGYFSAYQENVYIDYMIDNLNNNLSARKQIIRDIYQTGKILTRKYTFLKFAYASATVGIILLVVAGSMPAWH